MYATPMTLACRIAVDVCIHVRVHVNGVKEGDEGENARVVAVHIQ